MNHPELLAPGGDFSTAVTALKAGADAVYCGLQSFSARRYASNLSKEELRRLVGFAHGVDKKVYATMNTIIPDSEIDEAARALAFLEAAGADAVILQDLGLLRLARDVAPTLPIHASTQMGIHTVLGAEWAQRQGISRVILARELSLSEIRRIREKVPTLELEVFIHGALCYGFSGLCLASNRLTGRSGNRGECAQICRTWFEVNGAKEYPFSSRDLAAGLTVGALADMGVASLKIEGRMKGPAYVAPTVEWYRSLLDGGSNESAHRRSITAFSRAAGTGFLRGKAGVTRDYPGHRGLPLGTVAEVGADRFLVRTDQQVFVRDGLQYMIDPDQVVGFAAKPLGGTTGAVWLASPDPPPTPGTAVSRVSDHDSAMREEKAASHPLPHLSPPAALSVTANSLTIRTRVGGRHYERTWKVDVQQARDPKGLERRLAELFSVTRLRLEGAEGRFVPPSALKIIRREYLEDVAATLETVKAPELPVAAQATGDRLKRAEYGSDGLPFAALRDTFVGPVFLPPVQPETEEQWITRLKESTGPVKLGLGSVAHLEMARRLAENREVECWVDYGLYAANRFAVEELKTEVPGLGGISPWIEAADPAAAAAVVESRGIAAIDLEGFSAPLFITRNCFEARSGSCPAGCTRRVDRTVLQRGRHFTVRTRDCLSYVLAD